MSRAKLRVENSCADCSTPEPTWASINRGILICDECCSIHRCLGRHVSHVKSLKKGAWNTSQLTMVHALYACGANSIWEHNLLDPNGKSARRKPSPKDPVHPNKADFVRAKHQNLTFLQRRRKDDGPISDDDLNQQLHSSVRTANLETSLRLLSLGADPNYSHPEKGNCALHMAAKFGQSSQGELLFVYGADPAAPDKEGKTASDYAREAGNEDFADRLLELRYEISDRMAFYLCGRRPDHRLGQHFIIPEMSDSLDLSEFAKAARKKLQALPNNLFEELAMDVYDEIDRRESDAIWLSTQNHSALVADRQAVPFLPVNPEFSSTRNQGRQKLARFNAREFATLIIDILGESKRRHFGLPVVQQQKADRVSAGNLSDDEPVYDSVPSEEEEEKEELGTQDYQEVKRQLATSEVRINQLLQSNREMRQEISLLQKMVHKLIQENSQLRSEQRPPTVSNGYEPSHLSPGNSYGGRPRAGQRPQSMYERLPPYGWTAHFPCCHNALPRDDSGIGHTTQSSHSSRHSGDYDNTSSHGSASCQHSRSHSLSPPPELPSQGQVVRKTEQITKEIQELLIFAQESKHKCFIPCSENIYRAVIEMASIFPQSANDERIHSALKQLTSCALRLQLECRALLVEPQAPIDYRFVTQQVIQCAYDIAKSAKQLVTHFE